MIARAAGALRRRQDEAGARRARAGLEAARARAPCNVKVMLSENGCRAGFWMGNLKHKNARGARWRAR